jgi:hypothetical protein
MKRGSEKNFTISSAAMMMGVSQCPFSLGNVVLSLNAPYWS